MYNYRSKITYYSESSVIVSLFDGSYIRRLNDLHVVIAINNNKHYFPDSAVT